MEDTNVVEHPQEQIITNAQGAQTIQNERKIDIVTKKYIDGIKAMEQFNVVEHPQEQTLLSNEQETSQEPDTLSSNNTQMITDDEFWSHLLNNIDKIKNFTEYLLQQFGTKEACNRFDIGNVIEFVICDSIHNDKFQIVELPNAKRYDLEIVDYKKLSIKYSSSGDITLHNSNSCINTDLDMKDTILLTPDKLYLITSSELKKMNIDINDYVTNKGDSLKLKRKILTQLQQINYNYIYDINIKHDKDTCLNRLCSKVFYEQVKKEYTNSLL